MRLTVVRLLFIVISCFLTLTQQLNLLPLFSTAVTKFTRVFSKHEFHYLDVPKFGTFAIYDIFDCTCQCLQVPQCVSLNLAVNNGAGGKLLCELLSTDKYRNTTRFKDNENMHHFSIKVSPVLFLSNLSKAQ